MFSSPTKDKKSTGPAASLSNGSEKEGSQTTVIAKGATIEGKFACSDNVRLDGAIHGEVQVDKRLVMGEGSYIQGNIHARDASIKGKIKGDIFVIEGLHLLETAVIEGNISAKTIIVEEGARYNGSCKIGDSVAAAKI
ncbi:MAG: polymer-forming cytoskeletal protein [Saprospirales bacterium]|nr:polymer-forming cytoskeletal protein [Saprospirales bacterium]MBK8921354.1 polymer-forming cytoskeletal protein [Saprospirales bacterium]